MALSNKHIITKLFNRRRRGRRSQRIPSRCGSLSIAAEARAETPVTMARATATATAMATAMGMATAR
jgi:hypothetical protein